MNRNVLKSAMFATAHCLVGCGIGEVAGMIISTALGWGNVASVIISIVLAFIFGYTLTTRSLSKHLPLKQALRTALATDTVSITSMEIVDNVFVIVVPGALAASLSTLLFWWSLAASLAIAFVVTVPVNYWLLRHGKGHAHMHH